MIEVYSDGSHSNPINYTKPLKTKGSVVIYQDNILLLTTSVEGISGWSDVAEYVGIKLGLEKLIELGLQDNEIRWYNDNQFVMNYMQQRRTGKSTKDYYTLSIECLKLAQLFKNLRFNWIPREENTFADAISKLSPSYRAVKG